jgi:hypothetical protein
MNTAVPGDFGNPAPLHIDERSHVKIGKPVAILRVEPLESPVPRKEPAPPLTSERKSSQPAT